MPYDPIRLEVFKNLLSGIAEEMGVTLCRTAFSPNIKERKDFSCALFDGEGRMIAQAEHIPVHLGAMPMSVLHAIEHVDMAPGDGVLVNDPYGGGTHLPDITLVTPIFVGNDRRPSFFAANRAHHADVGGHDARFDAAVNRGVPGGHSHTAGQDHGGRARAAGSAAPDFGQRAHAARARRRPDGPDRRQSDRRAAAAGGHRQVRPARGLALLWRVAELLGTHDAARDRRDSQGLLPF